MDGQEAWVGAARAAAVQVLGPEDKITEIALTIVYTDDQQFNLQLVREMVAFLQRAFPGWEDSPSWVAQCMGGVGGESMQDGQLISMIFSKKTNTSLLFVIPNPRLSHHA